MAGVARRPPYVGQWMEQHGQQANAVADAIGLSRPALYRRLRGEVWFSYKEALAVAKATRADYAALLPGHSGVDPRDVEVMRLVAAESVA